MHNMELEGRNITVRRSMAGGTQKSKDGQGRRGKKQGGRNSETGWYYLLTQCFLKDLEKTV